MSQQIFSELLRTSGKLTYEWYINSARWERRKLAYYVNHAKVCRACGAKKNIHLHHHTYVRLGNEFDADLVPLCENCHTLVHRFHREGKLTLTGATRKFLQLQGADLDTPRRRKKSKQGRPTPSKRGNDPVNNIFGKMRDHRRAKEPMLALAEVMTEFGIPKKVLRFQGYRARVPLSTVERWRQQRPEWM
jgi:hypothetical protein